MRNSRRNYNFNEKTHSKDGKVATFLGIICTLILVFVAVRSIMTNGKLSMYYGLLGMASALVSLCGLVIALTSLKEEDVIRTFSWLGIAINGVLVLIFGALFFIGL